RDRRRSYPPVWTSSSVCWAMPTTSRRMLSASPRSPPAARSATSTCATRSSTGAAIIRGSRRWLHASPSGRPLPPRDLWRSAWLFLEDVTVVGRLVEDRLGEGTKRHELQLLGARPVHCRLHEPRTRSGAAKHVVDLGVIDDRGRAADGVGHLRNRLVVAHDDECAARAATLVSNFIHGP